ncbi:hypothetical protein B0J13DRAFT_559695 [Dactylonectria estremocensis]|uniref:Uncharacterized protein n=1 Tax=Dactylonectria estremocensis TaxID=1079267 RepID=A0A9P9EFS0_9HYPO|nr:hypothetical protein B0J13DRAFT_559695 [Dactylonectria estremocensis]
MPQKHWRCLGEGGFSNMKTLIQHLSIAHRLPPYCPVCYQIFTTAGKCEEHIVQRSCTLVSKTEMEGITDFQIGQLSESFYSSQLKEAQWDAVWRTLFDTAERPVMPYYCSTIEVLIRLLRHYWSKEAVGIILSFLDRDDSQGEVADSNTEELATLSDKVLGQMIDRLLHLSLSKMDWLLDSEKAKELLKVLYCTMSEDTQSGSSSLSSSPHH